MLQKRIIPNLLIEDGKLVKTVQFKSPKYIGDPINAIKIFNEKEVDEILVCDISQQRLQRGPDFELIEKIADECFMPLTYGGGITTIAQIKQILKIGVEKVVINSALGESTHFISEAASAFGSQCLVASIDLKKDWLGRYRVCFQSAKKMSAHTPENFLQRVIAAGAGEVLVSNVDLEGSWKGFDIGILNTLSSLSTIPVIASGGGGKIDHIREVFTTTRVSAVALGSMVVFQQKDLGVLINFPNIESLRELELLPGNAHTSEVYKTK